MRRLLVSTDESAGANRQEGDGLIRILFLPNFPVTRIDKDDPSVLTSNKIVDDSPYWFFSHIPDAHVDVLDNTAPFPLNLLSKLLKVEFFQPLKALVRQRDYDVIVSHGFNAGFVFGILRSILHQRNPPHFIIDVGSLNAGRDDRIQIVLVEFALRSVAGIVYHSTVNEEFYSGHFPDLNREFVPFGVAPETIIPFPGPPKNDYILSMGETKRDYTTLLKAWGRIDFPLMIVGSGSTNAGGARNIRLVDRVRIDELMRLIHDSRFVVLPLEDVRYSVGQMTLLQCMAMRKAVVVTNVAGVRDYCIDGETCLTVRVRSESDIVEKVSFLLKNPDRADKIGVRAREIIASEFNEKNMAIRIYDFIKRTLSDKTHPR